MFVKQALAALDQRHDAGTDDRLEQFLLAGEIQIKGALAHPRAGSHLVEPGRGKTALHEQIECRRHQFGAARVLASGPAADPLWAWHLYREYEDKTRRAM